MHEANEIIDGLWTIRQETSTNLVSLLYCGRLANTRNMDELLTLEDLRKLLLVMREELRNE